MDGKAFFPGILLIINVGEFIMLLIQCIAKGYVIACRMKGPEIWVQLSVLDILYNAPLDTDTLLQDISFFSPESLAQDRGLIFPIIARAGPVKAVTHVIVLSEQAGWQSEKSRLLLFASPTEPPQTDSVRAKPHRLCPHFTLALIGNSSRDLLGVPVT